MDLFIVIFIGFLFITFVCVFYITQENIELKRENSVVKSKISNIEKESEILKREVQLLKDERRRGFSNFKESGNEPGYIREQTNWLSPQLAIIILYIIYILLEFILK